MGIKLNFSASFEVILSLNFALFPLCRCLWK